MLLYVATPSNPFLPNDTVMQDDADTPHSQSTITWTLCVSARHTTSAVTSMAFAPKEQGLCLAVGTADGVVRYVYGLGWSGCAVVVCGVGRW